MSAAPGWLRRTAFLGAALCATAGPASAHLVRTGFGTFYDGIVHLVMTPIDLLAVVGLGLLGGLLGKRAARGAVLALPGGWLAGGLAGAAFPGQQELPWATALGVVAVGLLVAGNARVPRAAFVALACALGVLHGFVTGATTAAAGGDLLTVAGAVLAVFTLASLVPAAVVSLRAEWTRSAVRVAGSWIAAIGLLTLGWLARPG